VPFAEIGNDTHNNGLLLQGAGTAAAFTASVCDLTPYDITQAVSNGSSISVAAGTWISPHVPLLALAFDRYAVSSVEWHYEPQATATVSDRLVFAWTDDPSHPFLSAQGAAAASATPSQLDLLVTKDSVAFMPWRDWSMKVPVARDARFMYDMAGATVQGQFERFFSFGSCSCVGSAAPSAIIYGVLYVSIVVDLFDPVPIVTSVKTLVTELHASRRLHGRFGKKPNIPVSNRFDALALADRDRDPPDTDLVEGKGEMFAKPSAHEHLPPDSPVLVRTSRWYGETPSLSAPVAHSVPGTPSLSSRPASTTAPLPVTNPPRGTLKAP
jgi:hypothetical protein